MCRVGRQCRGMGHVCVRLGRQTETPLLARGQPVLARARAAQDARHGARQRSGEQRARLATQLTTALQAYPRLAHQARRLTQGKALPHGNIGNAYEPTIAPLGKGHSNGPAPFGRKPGVIAEPAAGVIVALHRPVGTPSEARYVAPLVDTGAQAIAWVRTRLPPGIHSLAGDLALKDAAWREVLHARGMLTVGIPQTLDPCPRSPTPEDVLRRLDEAD
jgi:hypothetical protein